MAEKRTRLSGDQAWAIAMRKERYGRYNWIGWVDRQGIRQADWQTYANIKEAMLSMGTKGRLVSFSSGVIHSFGWRIAVNMLTHAKFGYYAETKVRYRILR